MASNGSALSSGLPPDLANKLSEAQLAELRKWLEALPVAYHCWQQWEAKVSSLTKYDQVEYLQAINGHGSIAAATTLAVPGIAERRGAKIRWIYFHIDNWVSHAHIYSMGRLTLAIEASNTKTCVFIIYNIIDNKFACLAITDTTLS